LSSSASITPLFEGFTQQQSTAVAGGALAAQLDTNSAVSGGRPGGRLSPIADGSLGSCSWRNTLNFRENTIRYLRFQVGLMNKPG
jgi:hypothetical protein